MSRMFYVKQQQQQQQPSTTNTSAFTAGLGSGSVSVRLIILVGTNNKYFETAGRWVEDGGKQTTN